MIWLNIRDIRPAAGWLYLKAHVSTVRVCFSADHALHHVRLQWRPCSQRCKIHELLSSRYVHWSQDSIIDVSYEFSSHDRDWRRYDMIWYEISFSRWGARFLVLYCNAFAADFQPVLVVAFRLDAGIPVNPVALLPIAGRWKTTELWVRSHAQRGGALNQLHRNRFKTLMSIDSIGTFLLRQSDTMSVVSTPMHLNAAALSRKSDQIRLSHIHGTYHQFLFQQNLQCQESHGVHWKTGRTGQFHSLVQALPTAHHGHSVNEVGAWVMWWAQLM